MNKQVVMLLGVLLCGQTFILAQSSGGFVCPDASEKVACDSYSELTRAGDKAVTGTDVKYVCFRDYADEFFAIHVSDAYLSPWQVYQWNKKYAEYIVKSPSELPKPEAFSSIETYQGGVAEDNHMPAFVGFGRWILLSVSPKDELTFQARGTRYDSRTKVQTVDPDTLFMVNADQVEFFEEYTSVAKQKVQYSLTLQRSTKRFRESFTFPNRVQDNSESSGRCVEVSPFPRLPDPPELTEEQQDERQKFDYCLDPPESDDWSAADRKGYCASSFVYKEDYLAPRQRANNSNKK